MKVGIFLGGLRENRGGAHTFEMEIFDRIVEACEKTRHTFVVFTWSRELTANLPAGKFQFVLLHRTWFQRACSRTRRISRAFSRKILPLSVNAPEKGWLDQIISAEGIEVLFNLRQEPLSVEVPFISTALDAQHRLQPYFPEVSADGEWARRESEHKARLQRCAYVITGTQVGKNEIRNFYGVPEERIRILPHPTPAFALNPQEVNSPGILSKFGLPSNYLFYPAQFWPHKNHANLLQAIRHLKETKKLSLPVVFVGSDKGNELYIRNLVQKLGLVEQVFFLGFVSRRELVALYQNALAMCYVSFFGPENLPPLEAFALNCPVIAANVSGAAEQLGDAALLVDPSSEVEIAAAIRQIHGIPSLRQTLIEKGLVRARRFTGRDFALGLFKILDEFEPIRRTWGQQYPLNEKRS